MGNLATHQHGVVAHRQLTELGFSRHMIRGWLEPGWLRSLPRGVYAVYETLALPPEERRIRDAIPVTSVARTLLDVAETDPRRLPRAWDEAERQQLLDVREVERTCERAHGRRGLKHLMPLLADRTRVVADTRRELEARFFDLCRAYGLPLPSCNVLVEGYLVDAFWPQ